jgi:hypothetical protein
MGNIASSDAHGLWKEDGNGDQNEAGAGDSTHNDDKTKYKSFPGSAFLEKTLCGSIDTTDPEEYEGAPYATQLFKRADKLCISSPTERKGASFPFDASSLTEEQQKDRATEETSQNQSSSLLARALMSEVTDNPKTMTPAAMTAREKALLKAQMGASKSAANHAARSPGDSYNAASPRPVGSQGQPNVIGSLAYALTGDETVANVCVHPSQITPTLGSQHDSAFSLDAACNRTEILTPKSNKGAVAAAPDGPFAVTIALCLSQYNAAVGHPDTVTRQTAFDFNEVQDRTYKYVSSTSAQGWQAGGGEKGTITDAQSHAESSSHANTTKGGVDPLVIPTEKVEKQPHVDVSHIPILHVNCQNQQQVDQIIHALASGEIFIPHMEIIPEALTATNNSPPDLMVRFGCERNDDLPPDEWNNWCVEFMHNQCYEYFHGLGALWMPRPFGIRIASQVQWKTVKHMNRYFAQAERVIDDWRSQGPQTLDPELSFGDTKPEEVAHPHGIYLLRNGTPTNYFGPNFERPYTTRMTRSLLHNVLAKSWDSRRREWSSTPIPRLVEPVTLMAAALGCHDPSAGGFLATEATTSSGGIVGSRLHHSAIGITAAPQVGSTTSKMRALNTASQSKSYLQPTSANGKKQESTEQDDEKKMEECFDRRAVSKKAGSRYSTESVLSRERSIEPNGSTSPTELAPSVVASTYAQSVAASGTTVMHTNGAGLYSDEDWANEFGGFEEEQWPSGVQAPSGWQKKKAEKGLQHTSFQAPGKGNQRQTELLPKGNFIDKSKTTTGRNVPRQKPGPPASNFGNTIYALNGGSPRKSERGSEFSLDYSEDGASTMLSVPDQSTLLGQHYVGDASSRNEQDDESAVLSLQESTSSFISVIPTDEELLAVGWAKAMDAKSGNYYYFTFDRKKVVWDNPLMMGPLTTNPRDP